MNLKEYPCLDIILSTMEVNEKWGLYAKKKKRQHKHIIKLVHIHKTTSRIELCCLVTLEPPFLFHFHYIENNDQNVLQKHPFYVP